MQQDVGSWRTEDRCADEHCQVEKKTGGCEGFVAALFLDFRLGGVSTDECYSP